MRTAEGCRDFVTHLKRAMRKLHPFLAAILNLDEIVKLPAVYRHYKKYQQLKNLTDKSPAEKRRE